MKKYIVSIKPVAESSLGCAAIAAIEELKLLEVIHQTVFGEAFEQFVGSAVDIDKEIEFVKCQLNNIDIDTLFTLGADDAEGVEGMEVRVVRL